MVVFIFLHTLALVMENIEEKPVRLDPDACYYLLSIKSGHELTSRHAAAGQSMDDIIVKRKWSGFSEHDYLGEYS